VDKLLTGFDAPSATYLYIDKQMRDHGLFQAICRVNRLDSDDKEYGYIIDYKDLFKSLENAVDDYTSGALDGFDKEDVAGLLENRLEKARQDLEDALETVHALCETVTQPKDSAAYRHYFCCETPGDALQLKDNEPKRLRLYKHVAALIRAYAAIASEMDEAGYSATEIQRIKADVAHFSKVRDEIKLSSGDYIDLKAYEPAMRYLIDTYIRADDSEKISAFDDLNLVQLIVERGPDAVKTLPERMKKDKESVAETIENNVRKLIINESPVDPVYYDKMSSLLDTLIDQRRKGVFDYKEYLTKIADLSKQVVQTYGTHSGTPVSIQTAAQKALYNNLWQDVGLALQMDGAIRGSSQDGWQANTMKTKLVRKAIRTVLEPVLVARASEGFTGVQDSAPSYTLEAETTRILELAKNQHDY
jgi:type I restriction enzyme R subunit